MADPYSPISLSSPSPAPKLSSHSPAALPTPHTGLSQLAETHPLQSRIQHQQANTHPSTGLTRSQVVIMCYKCALQHACNTQKPAQVWIVLPRWTGSPEMKQEPVNSTGGHILQHKQVTHCLNVVLCTLWNTSYMETSPCLQLPNLK